MPSFRLALICMLADQLVLGQSVPVLIALVDALITQLAPNLGVLTTALIGA